jgi:hypothetical protein
MQANNGVSTNMGIVYVAPVQNKAGILVMILGVNLGYHSKKLYPLINDQYTVRPDEAFRFAVGSFIENV